GELGDDVAVLARALSKAMIERPVDLPPRVFAAVGVPPADQEVGASAGKRMKERVVGRAHRAAQTRFGRSGTVRHQKGRSRVEEIKRLQSSPFRLQTSR